MEAPKDYTVVYDDTEESSLSVEEEGGPLPHPQGVWEHNTPLHMSLVTTFRHLSNWCQTVFTRVSELARTLSRVFQTLSGLVQNNLYFYNLFLELFQIVS